MSATDTAPTTRQLVARLVVGIVAGLSVVLGLTAAVRGSVCLADATGWTTASAVLV